ncbi:hypothetical protein PGT21_008321 [Puccinia graminis f. sp. tritici]|uniref:Uncharacterized protein n=1 Tax=Puccinia graminis f. sp. tritici TaxID=56615 RepID=A0A5B0RFU4_PUCGR|nr:hypothetical protein PGT21_008321 [Puccinia graminis f. sp. tritici]KAA1124292.1 hypothetical protein PGTUg99_023379 [Puccinia graminis f. sp. tritici]
MKFPILIFLLIGQYSTMDMNDLTRVGSENKIASAPLEHAIDEAALYPKEIQRSDEPSSPVFVDNDQGHQGETSQVEHVIDVPTNPVEVNNQKFKGQSVSNTPNQSEKKEATGITQTKCTNLEIEKAVEDQNALEWKKECKGCCLVTSIVAMVVGAGIVMPLLLLHMDP